jgi:hypothetical protein
MRLHRSFVLAKAAVACLLAAGTAHGASVLIVADDGFGSAADCNDATPTFTSINAAIAAAAPGDTIKVCPGTYNENVVLNKNVFLIGAMSGVSACGRSGSETIIKPATLTSPVLLINSGSASGATVDGFTFDSDAGTPANGCVGIESAAISGLQFRNNRLIGFKSSGLFMNRACVDCNISGNDFDGATMVGNGQLMFMNGPQSFSGIQITNNCFHNSSNYAWFVDGNRNVGVSGVGPALVSGNTFSNNVTAINCGSRSFQSITITNNVFSNNSLDGLQGGPKDSFITNNQFLNNGRDGIALTSFGNATAGRGAINTSITGNKFIGNGFLNTGEGLFVSSTQPVGNIAGTTVNNNLFIGNRVGLTCNLLVGSAETLNAENNYWGNASGPNDPAVSGDSAANNAACPSVPLSNAAGTGDSVRSTTGTLDAPRVDYCPWIEALPGATLVTAQACYHVGDHVIVLIDKSLTPVAAAGGQFFLSFDTSKLSYNGGLPGDGSNVYDFEIFDSVPAAGQIDYAAGITPGGSGTAAPATMARLDFTATANICAGSALVAFRSHTPPTRLTDADGNEIAGTYFDLGPISVDSINPVVTCPSDVSVSWADGKDPWATGTATATDNCGTPAVTYNDDRSGLTACGGVGGRGTILRTWTATDCAGNTSSCVQTITVTDAVAPVQSSCPANIALNAPAGGCSAVVNYTNPTAFDQQHFQGFEAAGYLAGPAVPNPSTDWNEFNSPIVRVSSGTDGIASKTGAAHARASGTGSPTGVFSRLGGYGNAFNNGFIASQDVFINLADPMVAASTYGFDVSVAANTPGGSHRRDFVFHAAGSPGQVLIAGDNNSNFARRNDLGTLSPYTITSSGWYTFEWVFRNNAGVLAVDLNLRAADGTLLRTQTLSDGSDTIGGTVGGNRYMWFTFLAVTNLHLDNTSLIRPLTVGCALPSGSTFIGSNTVTCSSADACGNPSSCNFNITVNSSNTLVATIEEAGLSSPSARCITFEMWRACGIDSTVSGNVAFNSTNAVTFDAYADGDLPGAGGADTRTAGAVGTWWLPSNAATSGQVSAAAARTGAKGLIVGNRGNGNDGVIDNIKTPRLHYPAGETVAPVNAASSKFRSSYWFRTASPTPADGFAFKSETYGSDRTTYFGAFYQTAFGDADLNCGAYSIEEISNNNFDFVWHPIAANLTWGAWYRVQVDITFVNGANNDIVDYRLFDASNMLVGSALGLRDWEEGARQFGYNGGAIFGVDAIQFQARGDYSAPGAHDVAYVDDISYSALPSILIDVPCGAPYTGVTVRDTKHSLRRTGTGAPHFGTASGNYFATFNTGSGKPLEQGNLNNDTYIDILDFGGYVGRFGTAPGADSLCGFVGFHADFSGEGIVGTEDFTFIQSGFLHFRDVDPCGAALAGDGAINDISVDDLVAGGLRSYTYADFNLDGRLNAADVTWVAQHGLPRCSADVNDDQVVDVSDIFSYLNIWFADHPKADMNNNERTEVQDIFDYINVWFQGC